MRILLAPLLIATTYASCWMSTDPTHEHPPTGEFEVYGVVYQVHGDVALQVPDTWVRVTWMRRSPSGALDPFGEPDVEATSPDGSYRARHAADSRVAGILVEALSCRWDPERPDPALECCLLDRPTCLGCDAAWLGATVRTVQSSEPTRVDVTVRCGP